MSSVRQQAGSCELDFPISLMRMHPDDIKEISFIENLVYPFPWTPGNFLDSHNSGYECWVLRDAGNKMGGYFFMMFAVEEAHLLNITVHPSRQNLGIGRIMLDKVISLAREKKMGSILLEVRPSNLRALAIYERLGFKRIGLRKNYYPAAHQQREHAIVMSLPL